MRVLLVSTYELGHQPLHVASPAAELTAAGHETTFIDLAVDPWSPHLLEGIDAVAISVPMHTALRVGIEAGRRIRSLDPDLPVAFYGLYAGVGIDGDTPADRFITGEYEDELVDWVDSLGTGRALRRVTVDTGRRKFRTPFRVGLPGLDRYAHLATADGHVVAGYVEASRGCRHRCAHCPIPAVYDGRYRIMGGETVLADIAQQVESGAGHITFGDPDFLNAPAYAMGVIEGAHAAHPDLTFDITVKVEHLLAHSHLLDRLAKAGTIFIVSAVESLDDRVLELLGKGHTAADAQEAVERTRDSGIDMHPTWLPFTPWTTPDSVVDIARFVWNMDLAPVTHPVQLSIRLLIPDGSLILAIPGVDQYLTGYDAASLGHTWRAGDPQMDELQGALASLAEDAADHGRDPIETLDAMTSAVERRIGTAIRRDTSAARSAHSRPRLSEPWFCCSEPTRRQLEVLS